MKIRTVFLAVAAVSALSTAAFAGDLTPRDINHPTSREQMTASCTALESQYNSLIDGQVSAPKANKAEGLHAQGVAACDSNNSDIGVQKLEQAVRDLGVKPAA
jgi:hypothetical protein